MIRALFVCMANEDRSLTAETIFASWPDVETDSAGVGDDARVPLSPEQIAWADVIFVMEEAHRAGIARRFGPDLEGKRVICLEIPDEFSHMAPELVRLLETRAGPHLRRS